MASELKHLKEFQQVLSKYKVSDLNRRILLQTNLVLLAAPTSSGRNTIIRELAKTGEYHFIISDTTRQPRVNLGVPEKNGVEYWFRSEPEVLQDLRAGNLLEAAIIHNQQVSGISIRELERARDENKIAITDIEVVGVGNIMKAKPDSVAIFVLPPNFKEWMSRIKHRGSMEPDELRRRLESAIKEFSAALDHDYYRFVINNQVEEAAIAVHQLARFNEFDPEVQAQGRQLAEKLLVETKKLNNT